MKMTRTTLSRSMVDTRKYGLKLNMDVSVCNLEYNFLY